MEQVEASHSSRKKDVTQKPLVGMAATALRGMPGIQLECAGQRGADRRGSGREMTINQTTPHISTPSPTPSFLAYTLIPFLLFTLLLCVAATVAYLRRRSRLDELRHRLIPLYTYDPTEELGWGRCEEEELTEPLNPDGRLSLLSPYGTNTK